MRPIGPVAWGGGRLIHRAQFALRRACCQRFSTLRIRGFDTHPRANYKPRLFRRFRAPCLSRWAFWAARLGMTQVFHDDGTALGVTAVTVGPCVVVGKRTAGQARLLRGSARLRGESRLACSAAPSRLLQEGEHREAAAPPARGAPRGEGPREVRGRQGAARRRRLQGRRRRRRRRHDQGQGLPGRHEAPPHGRRPRHPRYARVLPPRRLDRLPPDARAASTRASACRATWAT